MLKTKFKLLSLFSFGVIAVFVTVFQWNQVKGLAHSETDIVPTPTLFSSPSLTPTAVPSVVPSITQTATATPSTDPTVSETTTSANAATSSSGNPLAGVTLYNDQDTNSAARQIQEWQSSRPADAELLKKIADQPKAIWLGNWNSNIQQDVQNIVNKAQQSNAVPVFIAYNIPGRDCGSYSTGGAGNAQAYRDWIGGLANGIGGNRAAVVLEPDALAQDCLQGDQKQERYDLLKHAVQTLKAQGNVAVYLDAGHANWVAAGEMSQRLNNAGVASADGFALNVSNFGTTESSINYGTQISSQVNGKHFVIDTSRNGNGPAADSQWCNPAGRALGEKPTTATNNGLIDGFLWLKYPGESDGNCNGAPAAGQWFADYALELARNAKW